MPARTAAVLGDDAGGTDVQTGLLSRAGGRTAERPRDSTSRVNPHRRGPRTNMAEGTDNSIDWLSKWTGRHRYRHGADAVRRNQLPLVHRVVAVEQTEA